MLLEQLGVFFGHFAANVLISFPEECVSVSISRPTSPVQYHATDARYIGRYVQEEYVSMNAHTPTHFPSQKMMGERGYTVLVAMFIH